MYSHANIKILCIQQSAKEVPLFSELKTLLGWHNVQVDSMLMHEAPIEQPHSSYHLIIFEFLEEEALSLEMCRLFQNYIPYSACFIYTNEKLKQECLLEQENIEFENIFTLTNSKKQIFSAIFDELELKENESPVNLNKLISHHIFDALSYFLLVIDSKGAIQFANEHACKKLGGKDNILFGDYQELIQGKDHKASEVIYEQIKHISQCTGKFKTEKAFIQLDGSLTPIELNCLHLYEQAHKKGAILIFQDISERKNYVEKMLKYSKFDVLTDLANREHFHSTLAFHIKNAKEHNKKCGLIIVELDAFQYINLDLGQEIADAVLIETSARLKEVAKNTQMIARVGPHQFAVILPDVKNHRQCTKLAKKMLKSLDREYVVNDSILQMHCSCGIAVYPDHDNKNFTLEQAAEEAVKQARSHGLNEYSIFDVQHHLIQHKLHTLERDFAKALKNDELKLYCQPQVNAAGFVSGIEMLTRWDDLPTNVTLEQLFDIVEDAGLILPHAKWMFNKAFQMVQSWQEQGIWGDKELALNVTSAQLKERDFAHEILTLCETHLYPPEQLVLEVTESSMIDNSSVVNDNIEVLNQVGVKFALDDFGKGYASIDYIRRLPINMIKVDRDFVKDIGQDTDNDKIIKLFMHLSKLFNLRVIAEGVELEEQLSFLAGIGCQEFQGFYFSKAVPFDEMTEHLVYKWDMPDDKYPDLNKDNRHLH